MSRTRSGSGADAEAVIKVVPAISDVPAAAWDACAAPDPATLNPFLLHAFLMALETSGSVGGRSGWVPQHLVLENAAGEVLGVAPAYAKTHSQGEYIFDHGWADAFERAGGSYYPKLQLAVPFTPVPGRRLLVPAGPEAEHREALLASGAAELTRRQGWSSAHITFMSEGEWQRLSKLGYLQRTGKQYHWSNAGYATYDDFLGTLASRKRKALRKERAQALSAGIEIEWVGGKDITEAHWDAFYAFYMDTGSRKWGRPYLNRQFYSMLGERLADRTLLVMAKRDGRYIAGALNLLGDDCIYGRNWGAVEDVPFLHFELCYYQAIEHAIRLKLPRVEAGAQGQHKIARGYLPAAVYSAHFIADPALREPVRRYLDQERAAVQNEMDWLAEEYSPFKSAT